jgi:hypothetical protein
MRSLARYGTIIVIIHALVVILHGLAHGKIPVSLSPLQHLFVASMIVVAPIAAMILLWTPFQQLGSWLLLCSMASALLFGVYHHFVVLSPDHISQVSLTDWGIVFHITAILLVLTEGIGWAIGLWALTSLQRREQVL